MGMGVVRINRLSKPLLTTCRGFKVESLQVVASDVSAKVSAAGTAGEVRFRRRPARKTHTCTEGE